MKLSTIARYHPFLWLGGFTLFVMVVGRWIPLAYDDRGLGTAWFLFTYVLTFLFQVASDLAQRLVGQQGVLHAVLTLVLGGSVYVAADLLLTKYARRQTPAV
jgi:hypothetical protein